MSVVVFSVFGTSKVNHKAQSCRQPSFVHSPLSEVLTPEVGYREWVITWLHTHYMHVSVQQVDWVGSSSCWGCTVMALHSSTAIKDRFAPQLENSVSCFRWPRTQQDGCQDTFEKEYTQQNEHHMVLNYFSEKKKRGVGRRRNAFWQKCNKNYRGALIKTVISSLLLFRPVRCRVSLEKGRPGQVLLGKDSLVQKKITLEKVLEEAEWLSYTVQAAKIPNHWLRPHPRRCWEQHTRLCSFWKVSGSQRECN